MPLVSYQCLSEAKKYCRGQAMPVPYRQERPYARLVVRSKNNVQFSLALNANRGVALPRHSPTMPRHLALRFAPMAHRKHAHYFQNELLAGKVGKVTVQLLIPLIDPGLDFFH